MLDIKNQLTNWVRGHLHSVQATWLNPESLIHGLKWVETKPGNVRVRISHSWMGRSPSKYTGSVVLACELAVEEALRLDDRMSGVGLIFMNSQMEWLRAHRGACEIRFKVNVDELERLRLQTLESKTHRTEFVLTLWSHDEVQLGSVTLQVSLQLQPYLTS